MRKYLVLTLALVLTFGIGSIAWAEEDTATQEITITVKEVVKIGVTGNPAPFVIGIGEAEAGTTPTVTSHTDGKDDSTLVQYTSVVASGETRTITAVADKDIPDGLELTLEAALPEAPPEGYGTTAGKITIDTEAKPIITDIGSCATGIESTDGANLIYTLSITNLADLKATPAETPASVTVTLTLTDDE